MATEDDGERRGLRYEAHKAVRAPTAPQVIHPMKGVSDRPDREYYGYAEGLSAQ
jgi:hypothetical protein